MPATYAGVVVNASPHPNEAACLPRLARRVRRPRHPHGVRFPSAAVMSRRPPLADPCGRASRSVTAGHLWLFSALPVAILVGARRFLDGRAGDRSAPTPSSGPSRSASRTTAISLVMTLVLGTPLAILLARRRSAGSRSSRHRRPADRAAAVGCWPRVAPGLRATGVLGRLLDGVGISIPFTTVAVVLAQTFVAAPFFIRSATSRARRRRTDLEDAARVDGAQSVSVFRLDHASRWRYRPRGGAGHGLVARPR